MRCIRWLCRTVEAVKDGRRAKQGATPSAPRATSPWSHLSIFDALVRIYSRVSHASTVPAVASLSTAELISLLRMDASAVGVADGRAGVQPIERRPLKASSSFLDIDAALFRELFSIAAAHQRLNHFMEDYPDGCSTPLLLWVARLLVPDLRLAAAPSAHPTDTTTKARLSPVEEDFLSTTSTNLYAIGALLRTPSNQYEFSNGVVATLRMVVCHLFLTLHRLSSQATTAGTTSTTPTAIHQSAHRLLTEEGSRLLVSILPESHKSSSQPQLNEDSTTFANIKTPIVSPTPPFQKRKSDLQGHLYEDILICHISRYIRSPISSSEE